MEHYSDCNLYSLGMIFVAKKLNAYLDNEHQAVICQMTQFVVPQMMKADKVHFIELGHRLFMDRGLGPVLEPYYKLHRIPKHHRVNGWSLTIKKVGNVPA